MRALIDGVERNTGLSLFKGADDVLRVTLLGDRGEVVDLTADTVFGLEVQNSKSRSDTPVKTIQGALVGTGDGGHFTVTVDPTIMDFAVGTYYVFVSRKEFTSNEVNYADGYATLQVV